MQTWLRKVSFKIPTFQAIFQECFALLYKLGSNRPSLHSWLTSAHMDQVSLALSLLHDYDHVAVKEYLPRIIELSQFPDDYIQKQVCLPVIT